MNDTSTRNIKVLVVCSGNSGKTASFVLEQVESLRNRGIKVEIFSVLGKGLRGYLRNLKPLKLKIKSFRPDIIHAHYGMSALLSNLQRTVPVVSTYHGSDINNKKNYAFSRLAMCLSRYNIFVSEINCNRAGLTKNVSVLACGVDSELFVPLEKMIARQQLNWSIDKKYVLFAGAYDVRVKNAELALQSIQLLPDTELIELKGYSREKIVVLMNAADVCLMTSHTEGSPQFIKEALACNRPVVSVDVGDVANLIGNVQNCKLVSREPADIAREIAILFNEQQSNGRVKISALGLELDTVALKLIDIYKQVLKQ